MPIHPDDRGRYPENWREISDAIKRRAAWQCECAGECGRLHNNRCEKMHGERVLGRFGRGLVVLTVAHLDHTPENCDESNLKAMCQGCHLHYDVEHHRESRLRREREALEAAGQLRLEP